MEDSTAEPSVVEHQAPSSEHNGDDMTAVAMSAAADGNNFPFQLHPSSIVVQALKGRNLSFQASWFTKFPWLHYCVARKAVLCYVCMQSGQMPSEMHAEGAFISTGFNNWKKALERFSEHENSVRHIHATQLAVKGKTDVAHMLSKTHSKQQEHARCMLLKIITSLGYLARQGLPLRSHEEGNEILRSSSCYVRMTAHSFANGWRGIKLTTALQFRMNF